MIVEKPAQLRTQLKKELKIAAKKYIFVVGLQIVLMYGCAPIFLYLEHCHHERPSKPVSIDITTKTTQTAESQLCHELHKHFNASRPTIGNVTTNIKDNRNNETADVVYLRNLTNTFCRPDMGSETNHSGGNDDSLECSFTIKQLSKWWYYILSIGFTFGKFYLQKNNKSMF